MENPKAELCCFNRDNKWLRLSGELVNDDRVEAKKAKNYALADELRNKVMEMGYTIKDTPNGPQVEKA